MPNISQYVYALQTLIDITNIMFTTRYLLYKMDNGNDIEIDLDEDDISLAELGLNKHPVKMKQRFINDPKFVLNDMTSDITFTFSEGEPILAHRCILNARCQNLMNSSSDIIHISNVSRHAYYALLFYLYTDRIPDNMLKNALENE